MLLLPKGLLQDLTLPTGTMAPTEASSELKFLFQKEGVADEITKLIFEAGVISVKQFAVLVDTVEELREMAKTSFNIDPKDLAGKVKMSKLVCSWTSAKARATEQDKTEAEAQVRNLAKPVPVNDYATMRKAFKAKHWQLTDAKAPAQSYVEAQLEKVEKNNWRAEKLVEVVADKEDNANGMMPVWDVTGVFKSIKAKTTVPLPANSEELRHRLQVMAASWVCVASQQTANTYLEKVVDDAPTVFGHYADYLLGERVFKLTAKGPDGAEVAGPNWTLLLSYEQEVRAHAANLMSEEGLSLLKALKTAWQDKDVKDLFFLTPLKLGGAKRAAPEVPGIPGGPRKRPRGARRGQQQEQQQQEQQQQSGKGKGKKGKNKGAGKGKGSPNGCASRTPDNKSICYAFNTKKGCGKGASCRFEHVCGICFAAGKPMHACSH